MDTTDIERILSNDSAAGPTFAGVFPRDRFVAFALGPGAELDAYACVFNSQASDRSGEHWMLFEKKTDGFGYYFDSYGRHPNVYPDVAEALAARFPRVFWNRRRLQGLTTTACGDYCVTTALLSARGRTLNEIVGAFLEAPDAETRDHAVRAVLVDVYGENAYASVRERRPGLVGEHSLHSRRALEYAIAAKRYFLR